MLDDAIAGAPAIALAAALALSQPAPAAAGPGAERLRDRDPSARLATRGARPGAREIGDVLDQMKTLPYQLRGSGFLHRRFSLDGAKVSEIRQRLDGITQTLNKAHQPREAAVVAGASTTLGRLSRRDDLTFEDRVELSSTLIDLRALQLEMLHPELAKAPNKNASLVYTALTAAQKARLDGALGSRGAWPLLANANAALRKLQALDPAVIDGTEIVGDALGSTALWGNRRAGPGVYMDATVRGLDSMLTQLSVAGNVRHPNQPTAIFDLTTGETPSTR